MFDLRRAFTPECASYYDECESLGLLHKRGMLPSLEDRTKKKERAILFMVLIDGVARAKNAIDFAKARGFNVSLDGIENMTNEQLWAEIDKRLLKTH
jgi:hypothetical protein